MLLLPGIDVHIRLTRGPDLFAIEGAGQIDPKISLTALTFKFRRVEVIDSVYAGHMFGLKKKMLNIHIHEVK